MSEIILLNVVYLFFPYFLYILYSIYSFNAGKKEDSIILSFVILTSVYFLIALVPVPEYKTTYLIVNIPLFISYYKKLTIDSIIISLILIIYYNFVFQVPIWVLTILYFTIYIVVFVFKRNKEYHILNTFSVLNVIYIIIHTIVKKDNFFYLTLSVIILYFIAWISLLLFKKSEEIVHMNNAIQSLEQEKRVRESLFKITHEIKNPIAVCKGYLDMCDGSKKSQKYIPVIKSEINRLLIILEDFMAVGQIKISKDILDINYLLEEVINNYRSLIKEKSVNLKCYLTHDEVYIIGDYNRLCQVFINLFKNAIESITYNGELIIKSRVFKNNVIISVKDNGIGMSKEVLSKIKEPFYTTKRKGSGLGIPFCHNILEAHSGSLEFLSKEGEGTEVIVTLPIFDVN